jgi:predicted dehydrogenase
VLRASAKPILKLGILGVEGMAERFYTASKVISGMEMVAAYDEDPQKLAKFCRGKGKMEPMESEEKFFAECDAVFINSSPERHYDHIMTALETGCHVICNPPMFLNVKEAKECYAKADEKELVLFEGLKTLYFPAFEHLLLLVKSGRIGAVKDIDVSCSQVPDHMELVVKDKYQGSFYDWAPTALLPIIKTFETECKDCQLINFENENFSYFTRGLLRYPNATAAIRLGKGMKVEGELIITGTKGYLYVPAPWWKPEYFEIRSEDLRNVKKYFYSYEGDGLRYMIYSFLHAINDPERGLLHTRAEVLRATKLIEKFEKGKYKTIEI